MKRTNLATRNMSERHTGKNIADRIAGVINEFEIKEVVGVTRDNAANMNVAVRELEVPDTGCCDHTLQLAVNSALDHEDIKNTLQDSRDLVSHFNHSTLATEELRKRQESMKKDGEKDPPNLQPDVPTRWWSHNIMLKSVKPNRLPIYAVLHDKSITKPAVASKLSLSGN